jgi:hypothetical protein
MALMLFGEMLLTITLSVQHLHLLEKSSNHRIEIEKRCQDIVDGSDLFQMYQTFCATDAAAIMMVVLTPPQHEWQKFRLVTFKCKKNLVIALM